MSPSNLYDYKGFKSGNDETGFFNTKGRISRSTFFKRVALVILIYLCSHIALKIGLYLVFGVRFFLFFETLHSYFLPFGLVGFLLIQGAKRMHDINRSGWIFFVPFYNIYLSTLPGDIGNNSYGIDPQLRKKVTYFDELESTEDPTQPSSVESDPILGQPTNESFFRSINGLYLLTFVLTLGILILINLPSDSNDTSKEGNDSIVWDEPERVAPASKGRKNKNKKPPIQAPSTQDTMPQYEEPVLQAPASTATPNEEINSKEEKANQIFDAVETPPSLPGGMSGWNKYLSENLKYPTQARRMGIEGHVIVVFVINTDGSIQDVEVFKGIGGGCDEEAVKIVKGAPKWNPGMQNGKPVRTRMRLPIRFKLSE
jgi:TonB family protein